MKRLPYTLLSILTGLLYLWLFVQLLFTPVEMLRSFDVPPDAHMVFLAERISVLMLGFAILALFAVLLPPSRARALIHLSVAVNMGGFAVNSFWGASRGLLTDSAIPVIGCVESAIALAYLYCAVRDFVLSRKAAA